MTKHEYRGQVYHILSLTEHCYIWFLHHNFDEIKVGIVSDSNYETVEAAKFEACRVIDELLPYDE